MDISESTKIGIIVFEEEMWSGKKSNPQSWLIVISDHLNIWWNQIVEIQQYNWAMVYNENKNISTHTMWRELKGRGTEQLCSLKKTTNEWG